MKTPREKYENDTMYHVVVEQLEALIERCHLTPAEVREAAMLACINYEMRHIREYAIPEDIWLAAKKMEDFIDGKHKDRMDR